jgi:hypothetical protein
LLIEEAISAASHFSERLILPSMRGIVKVHGGLLILEEGGPINGRYRFAPYKQGDTWNGKFGDAPVAEPAPTQKSGRSAKASLWDAAAGFITTAQQSVSSAISAIVPSSPKPKLKSDLSTAAAAGAVSSQPPVGGVNKKNKAISGYTKRRKAAPSEEVLAKRREAAEKKAAQLAAWKLHLQSLPPKPKPQRKPKPKPKPNSQSVQEHDPDIEVLISQHVVPRPGFKPKPRAYANMMKPTSGRKPYVPPSDNRTYYWVAKNSLDHKRAIAGKVVHDTSSLYYDDHAYRKYELAPQPARPKKR